MTAKPFHFTAGHLTLSDFYRLWHQHQPVRLASINQIQVEQAAQVVMDAIEQPQAIYGINTGMGALAQTSIQWDDLLILQHHVLLSHAIGSGPLLADVIVRLALLLKINTLAQGYSGVGWELIQTLVSLYNQQLYPCVLAQGSVGACGDLAPLAFLSLPLIGEGTVRYKDQIISGDQALRQGHLSPLMLQPKEGLALVNGLQITTAILLHAYFVLERIISQAFIAGCLSLIAARGSLMPFQDRLHALRNHPGPRHCARLIRQLVEQCGAQWTPHRTQDPYSLRCQAQVLGACLQLIEQVHHTLTIEINAVSDNPIVFSATHDIASGGNFHGEVLALAADQLALAIAEIGSIAERRMAFLLDEHLSGLPAFLVKDSGVNSGLMLAQVTAAALVSENKALAHPRSVDSIPTSINQEDHVSMSTQASHRLLTMLDQLATVVTLELIAATQGLRLRQTDLLQGTLGQHWQQLQSILPDAQQDHLLQPAVECIKQRMLTQEPSITVYWWEGDMKRKVSQPN